MQKAKKFAYMQKLLYLCTLFVYNDTNIQKYDGLRGIADSELSDTAFGIAGSESRVRCVFIWQRGICAEYRGIPNPAGQLRI